MNHNEKMRHDDDLSIARIYPPVQPGHYQISITNTVLISYFLSLCLCLCPLSPAVRPIAQSSSRSCIRIIHILAPFPILLTVPTFFLILIPASPPPVLNHRIPHADTHDGES